MVDCSHANSGKDPSLQPAVAAELAAQIAAGERALCAVMIESNLLAGTQDYQSKPLVHGRSITDSCLAWETTLPIFATLAGAVKARRAVK
jgi:3-deoxy-7-phosphoheptulonate synthase